MTANPHRGEVEVLLRGPEGGRRRYLLRPTFGALAAMEAMSGAGIFTLARRFATGAVAFTDLTAVVAGGLEGGSEGALGGGLGPRPGGAAPSGRGRAWERVAELVYESGLLRLIAPASELLWHAVKGDEELAAAGEAKAGNG
jgi:Phage tail tube protein, GTA-gp10